MENIAVWPSWRPLPFLHSHRHIQNHGSAFIQLNIRPLFIDRAQPPTGNQKYANQKSRHSKSFPAILSRYSRQLLFPVICTNARFITLSADLCQPGSHKDACKSNQKNQAVISNQTGQGTGNTASQQINRLCTPLVFQEHPGRCKGIRKSRNLPIHKSHIKEQRKAADW